MHVSIVTVWKEKSKPMCPCLYAEKPSDPYSLPLIHKYIMSTFSRVLLDIRETSPAKSPLS